MRCYGDSPVVAVPETVDGRAVTQIGDYCFSDSDRASRAPGTFPAYVRELSGDHIQRVILPDTVRKLGDLAFYGCSCLEEVTFGAALDEVGSDAFMNCVRLRTLRLRCGMDAHTGLPQILRQRTADTEVLFERDGHMLGELFYPAYDEYYDEIGPAHVFAAVIRGNGFRVRQCFRDGVISLRDYDDVFMQARASEETMALCRMASDRLYYPVSLEKGAKERYMSYLISEQETLVGILVGERDLAKLEYFAREGILSGEGIGQAVRMAAEQEWMEGAAGLLSIRQAGACPGVQKTDRYVFDGF